MAEHNFTCPDCGAQLIASKADHQGPGPGWSQSHTFQSTAIAPWQQSGPIIPPGDWHKLTPTSKLEAGDIYANVLDAVVSFSLASLAALAMAHYFRLDWAISPFTGLAIASFRYWDGMNATRRLLCVVETFTSAEPAPVVAAPPVSHIRVEVKDGNHWQFSDLPGKPEALQSFAQAWADGKPFTERTATSCGLSQDGFWKLRDAFLEAQMCFWKNPDKPKLGLELSLKGKATLRAIAEAPLPSLEAA